MGSESFGGHLAALPARSERGLSLSSSDSNACVNTSNIILQESTCPC